MKIAFFEIEEWEKEYLRAKLVGDELSFYAEKLDKDHIPQQLDAEVVSVFVGSKIDAAVLSALQSVKYIVTRSTGFDHIDLAECKKKNIAVGYVPTYGKNTVAEFAFGLILCLARKIFYGIDRVKETGVFSPQGLKGIDLEGKTIGIVGTGNIGKYMVKYAYGFGMNILLYDAYPNQELAKQYGARYVPFDELLKNSDVITLHVPYLKETHHLINKETIRLVKKGALLINTSRGQVVATEALVWALNEKIVGGAALDVLEEEGIIKDEREFVLYGHPEEHNLKTALANHYLIDAENVLITPHNAFNTQEALQRILETTVENIEGFKTGNLKNNVPS
ncbi:MAG: hydroxyacid dehydrogenase [Parcubacteria group bacterium]|nr:hydroxyacid dehydrogenase [Parcubacteria group bacterium]